MQFPRMRASNRVSIAHFCAFYLRETSGGRSSLSYGRELRGSHARNSRLEHTLVFLAVCIVCGRLRMPGAENLRRRRVFLLVQEKKNEQTRFFAVRCPCSIGEPKTS